MIKAKHNLLDIGESLMSTTQPNDWLVTEGWKQVECEASKPQAHQEGLVSKVQTEEKGRQSMFKSILMEAGFPHVRDNGQLWN